MIYSASLQERTEDKMAGNYIIKTREELDNIVADNTVSNKVIIHQDFAQEYFTPSGLKQYLDNVRRVNYNLIIELDSKSEVITDNNMFKKLSRCRTIDEVLFVAGKYPKEFMDIVNTTVSERMSYRNELLAASSRVSMLQSIIDSKNIEISDLQYQLEIEQKNKMNYSSKLHALVSRINYQYNKSVDADKMFEVNKNSYDKVIYIKEITRVQYIDSFMYYLKEIMKVLYHMPARSLVIEGYYAMQKVNLYPDFKPHYSLTERDVISGDILMLGMQPHLMTDILRNPSNISILIVLDRGGHINPHIYGTNVEYFYTASDLKDVPDNIPKQRVISYSEETLYIPYLKDFSTLDSTGKIQKYSSLPIVKQFIDLIERR